MPIIHEIWTLISCMCFLAILPPGMSSSTTCADIATFCQPSSIVAGHFEEQVLYNKDYYGLLKACWERHKTVYSPQIMYMVYSRKSCSILWKKKRAFLYQS